MSLLTSTIPETVKPSKAALWLCMLGAVLLIVSFPMAFTWAPNVAKMTEVYRILFYKMPLAIIGYLFLVLAAIDAIFYLLARDLKRDVRSDVGVFFGLCCFGTVLGCGMIWAKAEWGSYWLWSEPRLVTTLILFVIYLAYKLLRSSIDEPSKRARFCAVYVLFASPMMIVVNQSVYWWKPAENIDTVHPGAKALPGIFSTYESQITLATAGSALLLLLFGLYLYAVEAIRVRDSARALKSMIDEHVQIIASLKRNAAVEG
ncbi:MAG: cytochrome c biogenesis protein [Planctomycetes bacterium]|nr:cytochrome c biogenesis protein [Planctomycetota bacterium]